MNKNSKKIALISIMSGLALVLYFFEISLGFLFPAAPFLKMDFSDIPAVFTGIALGPIPGVLVQLIKNILHAIFMTKEPMLSGEIGNFVAGVLFILPVVILARKNYKKYIIPSLLCGTILMTLAMCFVNYFITLPLYGIPVSARIPMIISAFLPFNLLKGCILSIVVYLLFPKLQSTIRSFS